MIAGSIAFGIVMTPSATAPVSAAADLSSDEERLGDALQHYHRNLARRRFLIVVERRHQLGLRVEQALSLRVLGDDSLGLELFLADFDGRRRMRLQVVVPRRMLWKSALRRDNHDSIAVLGIHERRRERFAALGAGSSQQQQRSI